MAWRPRGQPQRPSSASSSTAQPWLVLSTAEFDVVWEHLGLGDRPLILGRDSPGATHAERRVIVAKAWDSLVVKNLAREARWPGDEITRLLTVAARPEKAIELRATLGQSVRALLAADRRGAVVVFARPGGSFAVRRIANTGLAASAVSVLPRVPRAPGSSITVRASDFEAAANQAGTSHAAFVDALIDRGVDMDDAHTLATMSMNTVRHGQFLALRADGSGRMVGASTVVGFHDTDQGGYLDVRRRNGAGEFVTITPADRPRVAQAVDEYLTAHIDTGG